MLTMIALVGRRIVSVVRYYAQLYRAWMFFQRMLALGCISEEMEATFRGMFRGMWRRGIEVGRMPA